MGIIQECSAERLGHIPMHKVEWVLLKTNIYSIL